MGINIKEIGKELMGKSLNSFHRKTGLTQLEKNNEMQDGILDGILSQIDDAYIEKTEQSNIIHLEGSGDGVVVVDSIEGNTLVNLRGEMNTHNCHWILNNGWWELDKDDVLFLDFKAILKPNSIYTVVYELKSENNCGVQRGFRKDNGSWIGTSTSSNKQGLNVVAITTTNEEVNRLTFHKKPYETTDKVSIRNVMILEGDWTDKEIPPYFEGLQSSFEEKVNDEGKYEIEILMKNKNLLDLKNPVNVGYTPAKMEGDKIVLNSSGVEGERISMAFPVYMKKGSTYRFSYSNIEGNSEVLGSTVQMHPNLHQNGQFGISTKNPFTWDRESGIYYARIYNMFVAGTVKANVQLEENSVATTYVEPKQNKIKLLLNSPLLKGDKLEVVNGKLCHYHKMGKVLLDGSENWKHFSDSWGVMFDSYSLSGKIRGELTLLTDKIPVLPFTSTETSFCCKGSGNYEDRERIFIKNPPNIQMKDVQNFKQWLQNNPITVVYELAQPYYEEVLNEYGEPILLEGYENGTIYIDSTIVPTTTVRYTPKMESFKTLKEVNNNNIMLTNDVNDNIIPYMMDVDLMIMEKEMALMSHKNIRTIGVKDMTSMQKRTQDMLTRLIKGKTLTEQECKTRVVTYLDAGKITDAQADELMLLISEVYA